MYACITHTHIYAHTYTYTHIHTHIYNMFVSSGLAANSIMEVFVYIIVYIYQIKLRTQICSCLN